MSSLDILKSKYKPYRLTKIKNVLLVESSSGKFIIKENKKDLQSLFSYLDNRGFNGYPSIVYNYENKENIFEYIDSYDTFSEQKLLDLANTIASLHNKTVYFKRTSVDNYKEIKNEIEENVTYLKTFYEGIFLTGIKFEFQSPSMYLFVRNYFKIKECLNFVISETDLWYEMVKDNTKERVAVVNNNIELNHFLQNNERNVLISWDDYKVDTPILDIVSFYKKEALNYDFSDFFEKYLNNFELLDHEKKLLFILISIPNTFELTDSEFKNTNIIKNNIDYIYKTENLIKSYYEN